MEPWAPATFRIPADHCASHALLSELRQPKSSRRFTTGFQSGSYKGAVLNRIAAGLKTDFARF
jgi:hypothetical protein